MVLCWVREAHSDYSLNTGYAYSKQETPKAVNQDVGCLRSADRFSTGAGWGCETREAKPSLSRITNRPPPAGDFYVLNNKADEEA
ncbi:hypothetical protein ALQ01_200010 [Pseudomonas savastanoi pv. glycinea]|nr:hypothetical protein ALQ01_200010 [Pseudomonas savastanoi pv. glycinea]